MKEYENMQLKIGDKVTVDIKKFNIRKFKTIPLVSIP
jgi:hypothetical protein